MKLFNRPKYSEKNILILNNLGKTVSSDGENVWLKGKIVPIGKGKYVYIPTLYPRVEIKPDNN